MNYELLDQGFVCRYPTAAGRGIACGPRCVVDDVSGDLLCSYMVQPKLGVNGFVPWLSRSSDGGNTWSEQGIIWPELENRRSLFVGVSKSPSGELMLFGSQTVIDQVGESFWQDENLGLKESQLIWATSADGGKSFGDPQIIPMAIAGAPEAPGPMCATRDQRLVAIYSPYNTFDRNLKVDRGQVALLYSDDRGQSWRSTSMLRFAEDESGGAEAWCIELSDGRLLGTAWHVNLARGENKPQYPNKYAISRDGGTTWSPTGSTGVMGNTTALAALPGGQALFCYVQRNPSAAIGIWLALVEADEKNFRILHQQPIWTVGQATQSNQGATHDNWTDFNFGEPCVTVLPSGEILMTYWYIHPEHAGIGYQKLVLRQ